jgi:hypothetical protein
MGSNLKPADSKARALLKKLRALAEQGIDGERISAQNKIALLERRFDFSAPDPEETPDLFSGSFSRSTKARRIYSFGRDEFDVANSVKWAIESATRIPCVYRDGVLLTEATAETAKRLREIAEHITCSFRILLEKFGAVSGVSVSDRAAFVMGLYDGMMNESRHAGQRLPSRLGARKTPKGKKREVICPPSLGVHPYTVAVDLGKQIRFSASAEKIAAELEAVIQKNLTRETGSTD